MYGYLYKYLALHGKLSLPGIGQFVTDEVPARIDFVNRKLYPFAPVIRFTQGAAMADKNFYDFIATGLKMDALETIQKFNEFILLIREQFTINGFVDLPGIGRLTKQFSNTYSFEAANNIRQFFPDMHAERVIRKNTGHTVKQGEDEVSSLETNEEEIAADDSERSWKIYALALALIAGMAIAYYYLSRQ